MASRFAAALGVLLTLLSLGLFTRSAEDHDYTLVIVGDAKNGYSITKNTVLFEVDYLRRTTWSVTSTADVPRAFQIDALHTNGRCVIDFIDNDPSYDCKTKVTTITPGAAAVVFEATAMDLWPWEYWPFVTYDSASLQGPVGGALAPADPELELERDYQFSSLLALLFALLSFGGAWWLRRPARS